MPDAAYFIGIAQQQGYSAHAAQHALTAIRALLAEAGVADRWFYTFRTGDSGVSGGEGAASERSGRPRLLLAFESADAALAFAQGAELGASPRLIALSLSQALAALVQHPSIVALLIATEQDEPTAPKALPRGLRIERTRLIELLTGANP